MFVFSCRMAEELPEHDILVTVDEDELNPFGLNGKGDEIRHWLASQELEEDIIDDDGAQAIRCFDMLQPLRPHPLMERQTGENNEPLRWLRLMLKLSQNPQWLLLFIRSNNFYVKGFVNSIGSYELAEPAKEAQAINDAMDLLVASMLPGFVPAFWSVKYRPLFNCKQSELGQKVRPLLHEPNFEVEAIQYLWNHVPGVGNDLDAKRYLGGIIFKLCEMVVRMRLHPDEEFLIERVVERYSETCKGLLRWKASQYERWTSNNSLVRAGIYNEFGALYLIRLVVNRMREFYERIEKNNKRKNAGKKSQAHEGHKGSNSNDKDKKTGSMDGGEEEPSAGNGNFQQIGKNRVPLLAISSNFPVDGIHVFDANHAQVVYLRCTEAKVRISFGNNNLMVAKC